MDTPLDPNEKDQSISEQQYDEVEEVNLDKMKRDGLSVFQIIAYSVSHFNNDLCASMWFVYLTWYLKSVINLDEQTTGLSMLSGQIADGICTCLVGFLSDKITTRFGKRMPWYFFGTILVVPSFLGIFASPQFVNEKNSQHQLVNPQIQILWYLLLPAIFNMGFAAVQISSMSIVNQITRSNQRRDLLSNNRNGFTSLANIFVLSIALVIFILIKEDVLQFKILCILCTILGGFTSLIYMISINEIKLTKEAIEYDTIYRMEEMKSCGFNVEVKDESDNPELKKTWKDWLFDGSFYIHGLVYTLVRIAITVNATLQPFYLNQITKFEQTEDQPTPLALAIVPLISYGFQLLFSIFLQGKMTRYFRNRFRPMLLAIFIITATSLPLAFLNEDRVSQIIVYPLFALQGIGLAIMLNTGTSLISDVIGNEAESAAFVYGTYCLFEKFGNGILLFWIISHYSENEPQILKWIITISPISCAVLSYIFTFMGNYYFGHRLAKITGIS